MAAINGQLLRGGVLAKTKTDAMMRLKERGIISFRCWRGNKKISLRSKIIFYESLLSLARADLKIHESLRLLSQTLPHDFGMVSILAEKVEQGMDFSAACALFPLVFDHLDVQLFMIAEKTGDMVSILADVLARARKKEAHRQQVYGALIYPALLLVMLMGVVAMFGLFVMPELEAYTLMLSPDQQVLHPTSPRYAVGIGCGIGAIILLLFNQRFRWKMERALLRLRVGRKLLLTSCMGRWFAALSLLLRHRIYLLDAVQLASTVIGKGVIQGRLLGVPVSLSQGKSLSGALAVHLPELPLLIQGQIQIGETSGRLGAMIASIAQTLQDSDDNVQALLLKMLPPATTLAMGGILLWINLPFYRPP